MILFDCMNGACFLAMAFLTLNLKKVIMKILLASNNRHKQRELQAIFDENAPGLIDLVLPADVLDEKIDVIEDGDTLEANAMKKADEFYRTTGLPCIADDTGLEIDALNGAPGVHSARFAGEYGNDAANRKKALEQLEGVPIENRTARFRTVICFAGESGFEFVEGRCEGKIIDEERGKEGFGYDPIFVPESYDKTFAQMSPEEKNDISHRADAARNFVEILKKRN